MNAAQLAALEFLQEAARAPDLAALEAQFSDAISGFGYRYFTCMHVAEPGRPLAPRLLLGRSPSAWDQHYFETGYLKDDPCVPALFTFSRPYTWSEMAVRASAPRARAMFGEAADAGLTAGFVVPVHGALGDIKAVRLISDQIDLDVSARPTLHALSVVLAERANTLVQTAEDEVTASPLTRRETECLLWVGEEKSDWDIGAILGISQSTVHEHVENAKRKLGCTRRHHAWARALARGWLTLPL